MKKIINCFLVCFVLTELSSCVDNTPVGIAKASIKCLQNKDFTGYVDLLDFDEDYQGEVLKQQEKSAARILENEYTSTIAPLGGIKKYHVISQDVKEYSASVDIELEYGNGTKNKETVSLKTGHDGKWKIDRSK